jgi:hypothetical protein
VKRKRVLVIGAAWALVSAVVLIACLTGPREPEYEGKKVSWWLHLYISSDSKSEAASRASHAVREIGTNALPWMLAGISKEPGPLRKLLRKAPKPFRHFGDRERAFERLEAIRAFGILKDAARPAIPQIIDWVNNAPVGSERWANGLEALQDMGQDYIQIPGWVKDLQSPNAYYRFQATNHILSVAPELLPKLKLRDLAEERAPAGARRVQKSPDELVTNGEPLGDGGVFKSHGIRKQPRTRMDKCLVYQCCSYAMSGRLKLKGKRALVTGAGCALIGVAVLIAWPREPKEPEYQGKKLSEWVSGLISLQMPYSDTAVGGDVLLAVQAIGTNGLPLLISWANYEIPAWQKPILSLKVPRQLQSVQRFLIKRELRAIAAGNALLVLGKRARFAVPQLMGLLNSAGDSPRGHRLAYILYRMSEAGVRDAPGISTFLSLQAGSEGNRTTTNVPAWAPPYLSMFEMRYGYFDMLTNAVYDSNALVRARALKELEALSRTSRRDYLTKDGWRIRSIDTVSQQFLKEYEAEHNDTAGR